MSKQKNPSQSKAATRDRDEKEYRLARELEELQEHEIEIDRDCKHFLDGMYSSKAWESENANRFRNNMEADILAICSSAKKALRARADEIEKERIALKREAEQETETKKLNVRSNRNE